ncbi:MAG: hypothetical protein ACKVHU_18185 [Acidimicrobiales bacterium]|jgi:hypothetical protein
MDSVLNEKASDEEAPQDETTDLAELRDELPEDLDRGFVGVYHFPDNSRRRVTGSLYLALGGIVLVWGLAVGSDGVLVNRGVLFGAVGLLAIGLYHLVAGRPSNIDENDALVEASKAAGFAVGHASAQLGWRGLGSRPTWRMLVYSAEEPPSQRGMVLIDAVNGEVVDRFVEENPEDWSEFDV